MANLNKVFLMGNLTRDPELRYTPSGTAVVDFGLAINRTYTTGGEQKQETCYVDVTMWGKRAVVISEYFTKGRPIFIEGRQRFDSWDSAEGRRSKLSVVAENFEFLGGGGKAERSGAPPSKPGKSGPPPKDVPPEEGSDVSDDEIPF